MPLKNSIKILGLGPGDLDQMPIGVYRTIQEAGQIYVRTKDHPLIQDLVDQGIKVESFDWVYEAHPDNFDAVYEQIVNELIDLSKEKPVLYGVPGHPRVAERTVALLEEDGQDIEVVGGKSFIDDLFNAVKVDPVQGFQLVDSFDLNPDDLATSQHLIVMQVFNSLIASDVKLSLMEQYPDDHPIKVVDQAGGAGEQVQTLPLSDLDHFEGIYNLRSLYVPPLSRDERTRSFATLLSYTDDIQGPEGDAWIKDQTPQSLIKYLKEETAELIQAIEAEDDDNVVEELGDVLMQVVYQAKMGENMGYYTIEDVLSQLNKKLRRRHPHVFDGVKAETAEEVDALWQSIKEKEKHDRNSK